MHTISDLSLEISLSFLVWNNFIILAFGSRCNYCSIPFPPHFHHSPPLLHSISSSFPPQPTAVPSQQWCSILRCGYLTLPLVHVFLQEERGIDPVVSFEISWAALWYRLNPLLTSWWSPAGMHFQCTSRIHPRVEFESVEFDSFEFRQFCFLCIWSVCFCEVFMQVSSALCWEWYIHTYI